MKTFEVQYILIAVLFVGLLSVPQYGAAQVLDSGVSIPGAIPELKEQISVDISPEIPKPNDEVTISIEGYGTNLNVAAFTWTVNGKVVLKGTGEKKLDFQVGGVGSKNTVNLHIVPVGGGPAIDKTYSFSPQEVDLLWEANTYTPPFYKGKALFTPEANVMLVAIANIAAVNSKGAANNNIVYTWKVDDTVHGSESGYGKNIFNYTGSIISKPHIIRAEVYSPSNPDNKAAGQITLTPSNPLALLYEDHPLYGILYNDAVTNQYYLGQSEVKFSVAPYFFSTIGKNADLAYGWTLNDTPISAPDHEDLMTFQKSGAQSGLARVNVDITSPDKILQAASAGLSIMFGSN